MSSPNAVRPIRVPTPAARYFVLALFASFAAAEVLGEAPATPNVAPAKKVPPLSAVGRRPQRQG